MKCGLSQKHPARTLIEYANRSWATGEGSKWVSDVGKLSGGYPGPRTLQPVAEIMQETAQLKKTYAPPQRLPFKQPKPPRFNIPQNGLHGTLGTGNSVTTGETLNGLTKEMRKIIRALFDHHLMRHLSTDSEKEVARSVERMFRHSLAKSDALTSFFADDLTADQIVKRIAINFRMLEPDQRSAGRLGITSALSALDASSSSGNKAPSQVNAAASWSALLRPHVKKGASQFSAKDLETISNAGKSGIDFDLDGPHAYDCGPRCYCNKYKDAAFRPQDGKLSPTISRKGSHKFVVPKSKIQIYDLEKMSKTLIENVENCSAARNLAKRELLRKQIKEGAKAM